MDKKPHNLLLSIQMKVHETKRKGRGYDPWWATRGVPKLLIFMLGNNLSGWGVAKSLRPFGGGGGGRQGGIILGTAQP
jgi:hypothetical protein